MKATQAKNHMYLVTYTQLAAWPPMAAGNGVPYPQQETPYISHCMPTPPGGGGGGNAPSVYPIPGCTVPASRGLPQSAGILCSASSSTYIHNYIILCTEVIAT